MHTHHSCRYPTIWWVSCAAHTVDLFLKDLGKMKWVTEILDPCHQICKFMTNHATAVHLLREHSDRGLLVPGEFGVA